MTHLVVNGVLGRTQKVLCCFPRVLIVGASYIEASAEAGAWITEPAEARKFILQVSRSTLPLGSETPARKDVPPDDPAGDGQGQGADNSA